MKRSSRRISNVIAVSDTHIGCKFGLCPAEPKSKQDGGTGYIPSLLQVKMFAWWEVFWGEWVPEVTKGEPYAVVVNGDVMDGRHHNSTTQISQNLADQQKLAEEVLNPIVQMCEGRFYIVRGTTAHTGESAENEERLGAALKSVPDNEGHFTRNELWMQIGDGLAHIMHHIGVTGSAAYESTAVCKEYAETCAEAARWGYPAPDWVVRAHRHRHCEVRVPTRHGYGTSFVLPGWQLKTPFVWKTPGGRITTPQFGGSLLRCGDRDLYTRHQVWNIERSDVVTAHY